MLVKLRGCRSLSATKHRVLSSEANQHRVALGYTSCKNGFSHNRNFISLISTLLLSLFSYFEGANLKRIFSIIIIISFSHIGRADSADLHQKVTILSDESFTFIHNGSFLQLDAGREWPFNSKREISFRFKTKSPHGLLIYQTFDHNKLIRDEEQDNIELLSRSPVNSVKTQPQPQQAFRHQIKNKRRITKALAQSNIRYKRSNLKSGRNVPLTSMSRSSNVITALASERLVNSLFFSSPVAAINGNNPPSMNPLSSQASSRDGPMLMSSNSEVVSSRAPISLSRNHRFLSTLAINSEVSNNRLRPFNSQAGIESNDGSTILSSSAINSFSASLYELYLKLENGRLKIMYEFGRRLNQTYCGKGLNDDRWHRVDLKVDPELNQMSLSLDQAINVEIALSQQQHEDEALRRNEVVFTNSVLYMGGLDNNASIVKNLKQRLYTTQFIGCIGQIMLKTDQHTDSSLQPVPIDRMILVKRGCINRCDAENYCLNRSNCVNYYTHAKCDCFGTNFEDVYCWQDKVSTLSMLGYSMLVYRIYDWRDRHHSNTNRLSLQFRTLALDSVLFFAYGDLVGQGTKNQINSGQFYSNTVIQSQTQYATPLTQFNTSNPSVNKPTSHLTLSNSNYLSVSLSNGTIVVEISFGEQPIILSNFIYDKIYNRNSHQISTETSPTSNYYRPLSLSDGRWHNITILHNNKQLFLRVDNYSINHTIAGKNSYLYFDPSVYIGGIPNLLLNETRAVSKPINLRHKFVGCLRSVYFNQHNILLSLKQGSPMAEYRDLLGQPRFDSCLVQELGSLPLTLRSGKSYLTFQLSPNSQFAPMSSVTKLNKTQDIQEIKNLTTLEPKQQNITIPLRKLTKIEFEYKTTLRSHFLAGGHLRDLSYHDLGGFWTLHAQENCQLYFTISSGLTFEPEQVIRINHLADSNCDHQSWFKISISMISGDKILNITRSKVSTINRFEDEYLSYISEDKSEENQSYTLKSSVELLHQVQLGGDLAKFGELSSVPFTGCMRRIKINGHLFDSRDLVTNSVAMPPLTSNLNHYNNSMMSLGSTQSDVISSRIAQGYVTLDSCQLVNPCQASNPCENKGTCKINEFGEPDCDCSRTGYVGKRCHFSIYKQSCKDLFLSGQRKSSHYLIDLDRNGPLKPIRVRCNMDEVDGLIETVLAHNLPPEYLIPRNMGKDVMFDITYLAFNHLFSSDGFYIHDDDDQEARANQDLVLRSLIGQSQYCRQYFRYECRASPLKLGNETWMEAPYPKTHTLTSLDGANDGKCMCATTEKKCLDPSKNCNCDSGESIWSDDSYDLIGHEDVGLTRIVILKQETEEENQSRHKQQFIGTIESQSRFTLSYLKCYETKQHENQPEITFKTSDAYIEVPGWRKGDISFSFRTASSPPAIILYQLATSRNHGYFRLTLMSDTGLLFEFIVNRRPKKLYLTSAHKLNNGEWQQVFIEYDSSNLRLTVNDDAVMIDLDMNDYLGSFEGPLFIGGAPSKFLVGDTSKRNGFTGCFRGLNINGHYIDLKSYLSPSMPTVTSSCKPSCTKNLCQNGGKCIEYWGSYECECSNPIAHSGSNCEINLNTNSITFVTQESYYVQLSNETLSYPPFLIKNILLSLRTYQETALILYASDHLNNFIQLHKNGSNLVLTLNSNNTIINAQVPIDDETNSIMAPALDLGSYNTTTGSDSSFASANKLLSNGGSNFTLMDQSIRISNTSGSGQPIQIKIERHRLRTTFYVNNNFVVLERPMILLSNYTQNPWSNPEQELVRPPRPKIGSKTYSQIFLANIDEYFNTRLPGYTGCIQGLSIDNQLFDFNRAHLTGELKGEYKIGCKMHCDLFPCKHQGTCIENWKADSIQCKCDTTSYVGRLCDDDIAALFDGHSSYFLYHLSKRFQNQQIALKPMNITRQSSSQNVTSLTNTTVSETESSEHEEMISKPIDVGNKINFFEVSLAFSADINKLTDRTETGVQLMVFMTRANSSRHFFLGLTPDGSLLIQEDYGSSMSLSRLIKRPDQPFNDGHRHMVKYMRFNQTIQIIVDHQNYLPTMSVISASKLKLYAETSLSVGTGNLDKFQEAKLSNDLRLNNTYANYNGCISNLVIKMDDVMIEPLSEAFGQNLEIVNSTKDIELLSINEMTNSKYTMKLDPVEPVAPFKKLKTIDKLSGKEIIEDMKSIIEIKNVEQGRCTSFKRVEAVNERKPINEPKYTPLLEPRPVYMEPPRVKLYQRRDMVFVKDSSRLNKVLFHGSWVILTLVSSTMLMYAYVLQARYKSERFRCETPFFHKRDEEAIN